MAEANAADNALRSGLDLGPMHGVAYALKDIIDVAGLRTTCHSRLRETHIARHDATVSRALSCGGGILLGKLSTHEFAIGGPSVDLPYPPARNPWSLDHIPGGSSSGSGAAVAAGLVRVALGTDTGGSIRWPASHCGAFGLKPTFGRVSRTGVFPLSPSLDHCGVMGWTTSDVALSLQVIAAYDPSDSASANVSVPDFSCSLGRDLKGLNVALPRGVYAQVDATDAEIVEAVEGAANELETLGAVVHEVSLPNLDLLAACSRVIMAAEAFAVHRANLVERPLEFAERTYIYLVNGAAISAEQYLKALGLRRRLAAEINAQVFSHHHAVLMPVLLTRVARFDAYTNQTGPAVALQTGLFNVTGHPAMSVPFGKDSDGLPLSVQIAGRAFDEVTVLRIAAALEGRFPSPRARPMKAA